MGCKPLVSQPHKCRTSTPWTLPAFLASATDCHPKQQPWLVRCAYDTRVIPVLHLYASPRKQPLKLSIVLVRYQSHTNLSPVAIARYPADLMIILIGSEKGGTGKTTIATNLAVWLAAGSRDVLLLDADRQGTAQKWSDRRPTTLPMVHCVQRFGRLTTAIRDLASRYDDVVIDCGGHDSDELRSAMLVADAMFIPTQASTFDLETLAHVLGLVDAAQINNPELKAHVFLSRAPTNQKREEGAALQALREALPEESVTLMARVIHDRRAFRDAANAGQGVLEWSDPKSKLEFVDFAEEIARIISAQTEAA